MGRSAMPLQRKFGVFPRATGGLYSGTFQNKYLLPRLCCHLHVHAAFAVVLVLTPSYCL